MSLSHALACPLISHQAFWWQPACAPLLTALAELQASFGGYSLPPEEKIGIYGCAQSTVRLSVGMARGHTVAGVGVLLLLCVWLSRTSMEHLTDAQLKAEWSKTVRDSAKQVGRANSNIKRYLGESVVNRQIEAVGARGLRALLAIVASGDISAEKREVVSSILSSAKKALKQADVGSVAAFSAVNAVYGVLDGGAGTQAE
jgi:hypothetical protein